jgi:hypothetical protein
VTLVGGGALLEITVAVRGEFAGGAGATPNSTLELVISTSLNQELFGNATTTLTGVPISTPMVSTATGPLTWAQGVYFDGNFLYHSGGGPTFTILQASICFHVIEKI